MESSYHKFRKKFIGTLKVGTWLLVIFVLAVSCGDIEGELASIVVSPTGITLGIKKKETFHAMGKNSVGNFVSITPSWRVEGGIGSISPNSSDPSYATFTASESEGSGYVVAVVGSVEGKALVSVTAKGWLEGKVTDTNLAVVQGARVYLVELSTFSSNTGADGKYSISGIPAGTYTAKIDATTYYQAASQEVTIASGEVTEWSPVLQLQPGVPTIPTTTFPTI